MEAEEKYKSEKSTGCWGKLGISVPNDKITLTEVRK